MKDFIGQELSIGDTVVTTPKHYRGLVKAVIISFTPKQVRVLYKNTWNFVVGVDEYYLTYPNSVVKIID
jgi:hypothetical protein